MGSYVKVAGRRAVVITPWSEKVIEGHCFPKNEKSCNEKASSSTKTPCGLLVASVLAHSVGGKVPVRLMNPGQESVVLPLRVIVAELCKSQKGVGSIRRGCWQTACKDTHKGGKSLV